jgi:hypothetical protein
MVEDPGATTTETFAFDRLAGYAAAKRFLDGANHDYKTLWSPGDDIHGMLRDLLGSARHSLVLNMFGYDDRELDDLIRKAAANPRVYVQMSLDKSQAGGKTERDILAQWNHDAIGTSIAVGTSSKHAISHLKVLIVDGIYTVSGSTNWSVGGETAQDNECSVSRDPVRAVEFRAVLDRNHDHMLAAMKARQGSAPPP